MGKRLTAPQPRSGHLLRVLGAGFGIAVGVGTTIGSGILRTPGEIAGQLGSVPLVIGVWALGGVYALLCCSSVTELGTMLPNAGGFYVYASRAFGPRIGFVVGCCAMPFRRQWRSPTYQSHWASSARGCSPGLPGMYNWSELQAWSCFPC